MRAHHFSAGTMCPRGRRFFEDRGGLASRTELVCHCVLLELSDGLALIDTGLGMRDLEEPPRLTRTMRSLMSPRVDSPSSALGRVRALGHDPRDVRDILVTHLDFDHAGGLSDFPEARVHVFASEHTAAMSRAARMGHQRYRPPQWEHGAHWVLYETRGDAWMGFEAVRHLEGLSDDLAMVPLIGHTPGHCGIAYRTARGWALHAGDAYFHYREMQPDRPYCPPALRLYQTMMESDRGARLGNQDRLRKLVRDHGPEIEVFCAHDSKELDHLARAGTPQPIAETGAE